MDPHTRRLDLADGSLTENTRAAYPITHLPKIVDDGMATPPKNMIMLTADAFGVLPIARLTREQAMYHFISGYTAKVAGTERGVTSPAQRSRRCSGHRSCRCTPRSMPTCSAGTSTGVVPRSGS